MKMRTFFLLLAVLALLLVVAQPAAAAPLMGTTITVTTTADDFTANGNCTLREAIQAANTDTKVDRCPAGSGTDVIKLGALTYRLTRAGRLDNANRTGDFDLTTSMTIAGAGMGKTIIELGGLDRAFDGRLTTITVVVQDMTIQNGYTGGVADHGGALVNRGAMTIRRVQFIANRVDGGNEEQGGAVWNKSKLTITGSDFRGNYSETYGGAIGNIASLAVDATTFTENYGNMGGAIYNASTGTMALNTNTKFYRNDCGEGLGGAVYNRGVLTAKYNRYEGNTAIDSAVISTSGNTTIRYSNFIGNNTSDGVIQAGGSGTFTLTHSYLADNAALYGEQISVNGPSTIIDKTTFLRGDGPALAVNSGSVKVANSTFSNIYCEMGSAIRNGGGTLSLESVTVAGTTGGSGLAALEAAGGTTRIHNTILTGSKNSETGAGQPDCVGSAAITSAGYNLISNTTGCPIRAAAGDKFNVAAGLGAFGLNGGRTPTYALTSTSRARDAGDPALTVKTDQRGYIRPAGTRPDIGAYEYGAAAP